MTRKNGPPKDEQEFWSRKAEVAKKALKNTLATMGRKVSGATSLTAWAQDYPLQTTGAAILVGFAVAGPFSHPEAKTTGSPSFASSAGSINQMQIWATLISTGADILKDVVTPLLQEMVMPKKEVQTGRGAGTAPLTGDR